MKLSEAVSRVIELMRNIVVYYERELPRKHPNYPIIGPDEETAPPPAEEAKLREFLGSLSNENVYQLVHLMHLGRGDFRIDALQENYEVWKQTFGTPEAAVQHMMAKPSLGEYLEFALEELQLQGIDVDHLPLKKRKPAKR